MTIVQAQDLMNSIYDDFIKSIYDEMPGRPRDIIINTLANRIYNGRKRARREFQDDEARRDLQEYEDADDEEANDA